MKEFEISSYTEERAKESSKKALIARNILGALIQVNKMRDSIDLD